MNQPPSALPPPVLEALHRGDPVEAIRLLRAATGIDLKAARERIDAQLQAGLAPASVGFTRSTHSVPDAVVQALQQGRTLDAIRLLREHNGLGLKEARDWLDAHRGALLPRGEPLSPGEVPRTGHGLWWVVLLAAMLGLAYLMR